MTLNLPLDRLRSARDFLARRADALGIALAVLYGLPTLLYPFGRDQAIFFYVGREWLDGRIPYVAAFDVKPPGVYLVHALGIALFGARMFSIRLLDIVAVVLGGWLIARGVRRDAGEKTRVGEVGAAAVVLAGFYFTCFDFWDSAQAELWEGVCLLASFVLARARAVPWRRAALGAGALAASATLLKFSAVVVAFAPPAAMVLDALGEDTPRGEKLKRAGLSVLLYGAGGVAVVALFGLYFAAHGALGAVGEFLGYVQHYATNKTTEAATERAWFKLFWLERARVWVLIALVLWAVGVALAARRRARGTVVSALWAIGLWVLAIGSGCIQRKFWSYHWGVTAPFLALCAAHGLGEIARVRAPAAPVAATLALVLGFSTAPAWFANPAVSYRDYAPAAWKYARGSISRKEFLAPFTGVMNYNYLDAEIVADAIRDRAHPGDELHVRGFEPAIYDLTGLHSPSRFASEAPLGDPELAFHRAAWVAEHDHAIWTARPRFIVTFLGTGDEANVATHGYHRLAFRGNFLIMERNP